MTNYLLFATFKEKIGIGDFYMNYNIAICDDEQRYIDELQTIIHNYFKNSTHNYNLHTYTNGKELLKNVSIFNIIFLDIELNRTNGIDIKNKLSKYQDIRIIFVSNYEQYMQEAYGRNVIAYIKKSEMHKVQHVLTTIEKEDSEHQFLMLNGRNIDIIDIIYIKSQGSYCHLFLNQSEFMICIYLHELLTKLSDFCIRVHRSYIVNIRYIKDIQKNEIILHNDTIIPISSTYKEKVLKIYFDYLRGSFL